MAEFHLLYVLVQSWWGRHLCWEHLNGGSDNELSSKNTLWKAGMCQSALQLICVRAERIHLSLTQVHGWACLSAPGPFGVFLCCPGLLLWMSWTIVNPTPMVSHQKHWHHFYLELKQVLLQHCSLTKSRWIGEPKHQAQIWVWSSFQGSSSLGFGFALPADGNSCEHSLCPQTRHWGARENFPCWSSPWPCRLWSLHPARDLGSEMNPWALWLNHFSCSQWCWVPANSAKTLRASCCQLLIFWRQNIRSY